MANVVPLMRRKTTADYVFDFLFERISTLELLPGAKISEADVASQLEVSRQPVRDAFARLENLGLLLVRPQKATVVKRFSNKAITSARFLRETVECEVLRRAVANWTKRDLESLHKCLDQQRAAIADGALTKFHDLDAQFHKRLCAAGKVPYAFDIIGEAKREIDRLCLLSIADSEHMRELLGDHTEIVRHLESGDEAAIVEAGMKHLSRLDVTLKAVQQEHPSYFED